MSKKKSDEKRIIPLKNYFILIGIFALFVLIIFYLVDWYDVSEEYRLEIPIIRESINREITSDDLNHYLIENSNIILYLCTSYDYVCRDFEKEFKEFLEDEDYEHLITYLNLTGIDQNEFVDKFNARHNFRINLTTHYPAFIVFDEHNIVDILQGGENEGLTMGEVRRFLNRYRLEEQ